jgi:hypothetical protein
MAKSHSLQKLRVPSGAVKAQRNLLQPVAHPAGRDDARTRTARARISSQMTSETRDFGALPRFGQSFSIQGPEKQAHEKEHGLIERAWYRQQSQSSRPAKWFRDAAVAGQEPDSPDRSENECARGLALCWRTGQRRRQPTHSNLVSTTSAVITPSGVTVT